LLTVTAYDNGTPENYTQYYYDSAGNKLRMYTGLGSPLTIAGLDDVSGADTDYSVTKYKYNSFNRLIEMTDPLGQTEAYTYDLNGNLTEKTDRNGNEHTFVYDGLGRILSKTVVTSDGTGDEAYTYTYTLTGNRLSSTGGGITTTCRYDALGRLIKETETGGIEKTYTYDAGNNRKSFVLKQNGITKINASYAYDTMNRLWKVYEDGIQTAAYTYDANGNRQSLTYNASGNSTEYAYNLANKLKLISNKQGTNIISSYAYTYYLDGNQASKTDHTGKVTSYTYDDLGRLESESPQGEATIVYTYDDYNNRAAMTVGSEITSYTYDKNSRLITETKSESNTDEIIRYYYDNNGNQICKTSETIEPGQSGSSGSYNVYVLEDSDEKEATFNEYNGFNQLKKVITGGVVAEYRYNADGLRTTKTVNGTETRHIWDGRNIAAELSGTEMTAKYVRGINLIYKDMAGTVNYYLFNGHGDVVQLTGSDGNVTKAYDYDAFGNEKNPDTGDTNPFRYCGEYFDKETGTYYLRARYYNPVIGRFITEDTYLGVPNDPLSLNLYTYCANNPIAYIDPAGHDWESIKDLFYNAMSHSSDFLRGLGMGVLDTVTYGISKDLDPFINRNNDVAYYSGKVVAELIVIYYGSNGTIASAGSAIIASPSGVGAIGFGVAAVYCGSVVVSGGFNAVADAKNLVQAIKFASNNRISNADEGRSKVVEDAEKVVDDLPTGGKITGYTKQGSEQALGRDGGIGVSNKAITDAVNNPVKPPIPQSGGTTKYIGKDATVVLNQDGKVVTTWANSSAGTR